MDQPELDRKVRYNIYQHFLARGRAPDSFELASEAGVQVEDIDDALGRLEAAREIVLAPGSTKIWMAHPFSAVPSPYPVQTAQGKYWANCAWDALGVAALLEVDTETRTQCLGCGEELTMRVRDGEAEPEDALVHLLVPASRFWDNVGFT
jgi:hypothetical protein